MLVGLPKYTGTRLCPLLIIRLIVSLRKRLNHHRGARKACKGDEIKVQDISYLSSLALRSRENTEVNGVIASLAVFAVKSSAPEIMVVSLWLSSPPFPA